MLLTGVRVQEHWWLRSKALGWEWGFKINSTYVSTWTDIASIKMVFLFHDRSGVHDLLLQQLKLYDEPAGHAGRAHLADRQLLHLLVQAGTKTIKHFLCPTEPLILIRGLLDRANFASNWSLTRTVSAEKFKLLQARIYFVDRKLGSKQKYTFKISLLKSTKNLEICIFNFLNHSISKPLICSGKVLRFLLSWNCDFERSEPWRYKTLNLNLICVTQVKLSIIDWVTEFRLSLLTNSVMINLELESSSN